MTERLTDQLSPPARAALEAILGTAFTMIGTVRPLQAIVNLALPHFECLVRGGLVPEELCLLLSEHGVAGDGGAIIPKSSLTCALSRARRRVAERSAASCGAGPQPSTDYADRLHSAAIDCMALQPAASNFDESLSAATRCNAPQLASLDPESLRTAERRVKDLGHPRGGPGPPMRRTIDRMSPTRQRALTLRAIQDLEKSNEQD